MDLPERLKMMFDGKDKNLLKEDMGLNAPENKKREDSRAARGAEFFCPAVAVSRLPYKCIKGNVSDKIAKAFFDGGKFWSRQWDLYYVYPPGTISHKPLLLLPREQVQKLVDEINKKFPCSAFIPTNQHLGFLLSFLDDGTPQPRLLGTSTSPDMKADLELKIPPPGSSDENERVPSANATHAFQQKMEAAYDAQSRKSKLNKLKKQADQVEKIQAGQRAIKRAQCYLGLRKRIPDSFLQHDDYDSDPARQAHVIGIPTMATAVMPPLNVHEAARFPFAEQPIFICVDIESNERAHSQITEIGISSLDTLDLIGIPPGDGGCNWMKRIKTRHFRTKEYRHVSNSDFVSGCPENFEFGKSEWISIKDAARKVEQCFQHPYAEKIPYSTAKIPSIQEEIVHSDDEEEGGVTLPKDDGQSRKLSSDDRFVLLSKPARRNIVLVGHDINRDVEYMKTLGCTIFSQSSETADNDVIFLDNLDTSTLYRILKREKQPLSLGNILLELKIDGWNLHNAGNDAHYTMQSLIGMIINSRLDQDRFFFEGDENSYESDEYEEPASKGFGEKLVLRAKKAREKINEDRALWDEVLGYNAVWGLERADIDGGIPNAEDY